MTILKSPDNPLVRIQIEAICHDCGHRHKYDVQPDQFGRAAADWERKHRGHSFEFLSPSRFIPRGFDDDRFEQAGQAPWWLDYKHNADIKIAYAADAAFTITLASLASSTTFLSGQEATSVSNSSNKYLDVRISGKITTGTSPTVDREFRVYGIAPIEDGPTWPDVFDGTDSAETVTNAYILDRLPILWAGSNSSTSNVTYPITNAMTLAEAFGIVPADFSVYVAHSTGVNLNSTAGNHELRYQGIYATST